jgi:hypothetical protein
MSNPFNKNSRYYRKYSASFVLPQHLMLEELGPPLSSASVRLASGAPPSNFQEMVLKKTDGQKQLTGVT